MTEIASTRSVLLIEDDVVDHIIITRGLKQYKETEFICIHAWQIADVAPLLESNDFDIIISDMDLPDSRGLDTIHSLKDIVGRVPFIVLSGSEDATLATESIQVGAQDFISKRYIEDTGLIVRSMTHAIERNQLRVGLEETRDKAHFLAHYDQITKLPNRVLFLERLNYSIRYAARSKEKVSLCFIDLDGFKSINDTIGHDAGDEVLRCVGQRMNSLVRESDLVARIGGDEFVVILNNVKSEPNLRLVAQKLIESINEPIEYDAEFCNVGASIGIATYPNNADSAEGLLKYADLAMYYAKNNGKNQARLFTHELIEKKDKGISQQTELYRALEQPDEHFKLFYQPRIDLKQETICSVEALIRWHHPTLGLIGPEQFIPIAEKLDIISRIDEWVVEATCKKMVALKALKTKMRVGINISGKSFNNKSFVSSVIEPLLDKYNINGELLEIEIKEIILLEDFDEIYKQLIKLKNLGISIAIDGIGTGFSSLDYLSKLPIDTLKIDKSFICDTNSDHSDQILLKSIIGLGQALDLVVVAKGIETESQLHHLKSVNCNKGQGHFWSIAMENWDSIKNIAS
jgi:diguanylate cyclase (GGDEF)-like protein